ncbi:MAG: Nramp family divalent metal transporter [Nitrosopumilaceae archaeon]|nr:Nramp family divalent metal transporter [Nitrosopumilaceae archaeon]
MASASNMFKTFGPGIMFACTAIGVSHLIQATRAGAEFGFALLGFVIAANLLKYPFYEFSSRYTSATGTSLIDGYLRLGRSYLLLYLAITVASMFFVTGAVGFVTAGFMENLFSAEFLDQWTLVILFAVCAAILVAGRYTVLDSLIKVIAAVLVVSTILAFAIAVYNGPSEPVPGFEVPEVLSGAGIFFLIALMGWMPMPIDTSTWHSLWTLERIKQTGFRPRLRETLLDFNVGYGITAVLAVLFLVLGTYIFFGSGEELPNNNSLFAGKIVTLYTETVGEWSELVISASAFSVMFGTIIAVLDGYSRALSRMTRMVGSLRGGPYRAAGKQAYDGGGGDRGASDSDNDRGGGDRGHGAGHNHGTAAAAAAEPLPATGVDAHHDDSKGLRYPVYIILLVAGSLAIVTFFGDKLKELVDFATIVSFMIAPVIALFNFRLVTGRYIERNMQPPAWLKVLACAGIAFLVGFAAFFALVRLEVISL